MRSQPLPILTVLLAFLLFPMAATAQPPRNMPVPVLDLQRYSGTWHQVAHLPMFFQRNCVRDTTATYTPQADGSIEVRNACTRKDGKRIESIGVAEPVPGAPGSLRVRFAPDWLGWLPFTWAPYWVIDVDPDYRWAMVGGPDRKYLWILSRDPRMDPARYEALVEQAQQLGYPVEELIREPGAG
ncbi:lipocalin family protein [Pseudoxanthomonas suwonensis]|uniref:Outer membrane lipoprotein Blc n=1 Tax=Pseudoxanthomonas suwonensis TaxID=314722 RepID=A0A0E3UPG8_9GAMM|nr:lipocalin family protein [Pseudoxanthomonas suwonensis]AKC88026.1 membrane protein [Pseudoxanthomonas suwonensis]